MSFGVMDRKRSEDGATLILVMVFVFALSLSLVAMGTLATNAIKNTVNFRAQRTAIADAENEVTISSLYLRTNFTDSSSTFAYNLKFFSPCPGLNGVTVPSADVRLGGSAHVIVWCAGTILNGSASTRTLDYFAFLCGGGCSASGSPSSTLPTGTLVLHAQVVFDDIPASGVPACTSNTNESTCGQGMTTTLWDQALAD